jgi:hypothetical protein
MSDRDVMIVMEKDKPIYRISIFEDPDDGAIEVDVWEEIVDCEGRPYWALGTGKIEREVLSKLVPMIRAGLKPATKPATIPEPLPTQIALFG